MQECLHRSGHVSVPYRVAYEHNVVSVKIFHGCGDHRIIALLNRRKLSTGSVKHGIVVVLIRCLRHYFYHIAAQSCAYGLRHTLRVAGTGAVEYNTAAGLRLLLTVRPWADGST